MAPASKHRETILSAAAKLFRRHGYSGTGLAEILAESGAPKGSLYHHFPGGKAEIGAASVGFASRQVTLTLQTLAAKSSSPSTLMRAYAGLLAGWMEQSGSQAGCPIATVLLETATQDRAISDAGREAFTEWAAVLTLSMREAGISEKRAFELGRFAIGAIEGALILSRVGQSGAAILAAGEELAALIERESMEAQ